MKAKIDHFYGFIHHETFPFERFMGDNAIRACNQIEVVRTKQLPKNLIKPPVQLI
jgi:hypothetical protein